MQGSGLDRNYKENSGLAPPSPTHNEVTTYCRLVVDNIHGRKIMHARANHILNVYVAQLMDYTIQTTQMSDECLGFVNSVLDTAYKNYRGKPKSIKNDLKCRKKWREIRNLTPSVYKEKGERINKFWLEKELEKLENIYNRNKKIFIKWRHTNAHSFTTFCYFLLSSETYLSFFRPSFSLQGPSALLHTFREAHVTVVSTVIQVGKFGQGEDIVTCYPEDGQFG